VTVPMKAYARGRSLAEQDSYSVVVPDNSGVSIVPIPQAVSAPAAATAGAMASRGFLLKPPPRRQPARSQSVAAPVRKGPTAPRTASLAESTTPADGDSEQARSVYQLSPQKPDTDASGVEAVETTSTPTAAPAGLRGVVARSATMEVVEIVSAIAGAAMTRVLDNSGDVRWELDQMPRDAVHPRAATSSPSAGAWQRKTIPIEGFWVENLAGQRTYANFEVNFNYNGASVGYVEVSETGSDDAWAWGLTVRETMTQDPGDYADKSTHNLVGALKLRFHYRFDHAPMADEIAIQDLTLFGNGGYTLSGRWTQS
jgi:hypothetical protein